MATQAERRARTRGAILEAAARVIVEHGEKGFSTIAVAAESGFSNGALFRHFPTRQDLVVAAVEHVLADIRRSYRANIEALDIKHGSGADNVETVIEFIWASTSDARLMALLEFFCQARTDAALRARLEPIEAHHNRESAAITDRLSAAASGESDRVLREFIDLALVAMRGVAVNNLVGASVGAHERVKELLVAAYGLASQRDD